MLIKNTGVIAAYPWPEDCFVQGGSNGLVLPHGSMEKVFEDSKETIKVLAEKVGITKGAIPQAYTTAFVEAFPNNPSTFIRGEGKTVEEAETDAWLQFQKVIQCVTHEFERRNYTNGAGFCKHCGLFKGKAFKPNQFCVVCQKPTNQKTDKNGNWYCKDHPVPEELKSEWRLRSDKWEAERKERLANGTAKPWEIEADKRIRAAEAADNED